MTLLKYSIPTDYFVAGDSSVDRSGLSVTAYLAALKDQGQVVSVTESRITNLSDPTKLPREFQVDVVFAEGVDPTPVTENLRQRYIATLLGEDSEN